MFLSNSVSPTLVVCRAQVDQTLRYENPFMTATSRSVISDIYSLARQLCNLDIPKPLAMLYILFRLKPPDAKRKNTDSSWFQGMRVWTEIGDICESESFGKCTFTIVYRVDSSLLFLFIFCRWSQEKYRRTYHQRPHPPRHTPRHDSLSPYRHPIILHLANGS